MSDSGAHPVGLDSELERCFRAVFPALVPANLASASVDTVPDWDSLHAIMLIAVLEETFKLRIAPTEYPELRSYASVREYLLGVRER